MDNNFLQDLLKRSGLNLDLSSLFGNQGGQPGQVPNLQLPNPNVTGQPAENSVSDQAALIRDMLTKRFAPSAAQPAAPVQTPIELQKTDFGAQIPARQPLATPAMNLDIKPTAHSGSGIAAGIAKFVQGLNNLRAKNEELNMSEQERKAQNAEKKDMYQWEKEFNINANERDPKTVFDRDLSTQELDIKKQKENREAQMDAERINLIRANVAKRMGGGTGSSKGHKPGSAEMTEVYKTAGVSSSDTDEVVLEKLRAADLDVPMNDKTRRELRLKTKELESNIKSNKGKTLSPQAAAKMIDQQANDEIMSIMEKTGKTEDELGAENNQEYLAILRKKNKRKSANASNLDKSLGMNDTGKKVSTPAAPATTPAAPTVKKSDSILNKYLKK